MGRSSAWKPGGKRQGCSGGKLPTLSSSGSLWAEPVSPREGFRVSKQTQFSTRNVMTTVHSRSLGFWLKMHLGVEV